MTYVPVQFEVAMSNGLGVDALIKKIHYLTFDLDLVPQYPQQHVTYALAKVEVVTFTDI